MMWNRSNYARLQKRRVAPRLPYPLVARPRAPQSSWSAASGESNLKRRLFCFPWAGAGAVSYRPWLNQFPADVEVVPVEPPGRGARIIEAPFTDVRALARDLAPGLISGLAQPYALFGHSLGALLAFEIARIAELPPIHLFVSAHRAPTCPFAGRPLYNLREAAFHDELRRLGGVPEVVLREVDLMRLLTPAIRADLQMSETYIPNPAPFVLPCPITAYAGSEDERVPAAAMRDWSLHTAQSFCLHEMDGGHFYLQQPNCGLVGMITAALRESGGISSEG